MDTAHVDLAAASHDLMRAEEARTLLDLARSYGVPVNPVEEELPVLLHGPVAAVWLRRQGVVSDDAVIEAIQCHTTGRRGMGTVSKVVFLADKLEPGKAKRYPYQEMLMLMALESLDRALLEFLNRSLADFLARGYPIHPESVELRNELLSSHGETRS